MNKKNDFSQKMHSYLRHPASLIMMILVKLAALITFTVLIFLIVYILVHGVPSVSYTHLVMDEAVCAVDLGLLSEEKLVKFVKHKPRGLEIVMTGHHMTDALFECADYVTEMTKVKHPYDTGRSAREGIEF